MSSEDKNEEFKITGPNALGSKKFTNLDLIYSSIIGILGESFRV